MTYATSLAYSRCMETMRLPVLGGPADGQEMPFDTAPLYIFTEGFAVAHVYRVGTEDEGRAWVYAGAEPLDAAPSCVTGWRL